MTATLGYTHDKFHASATTAFADKDEYFPSKIDYKLRELEEESIKWEAEDITCLVGVVEAHAEAVHVSPKRHTTKIKFSDNLSFEVSLEVEPGEVSADPSSTHKAPSDVQVMMEIDVSDHTLRDRVLRLCLPFLQPDHELREQVYSEDRSMMHVSLILSQAQLAQALVTSKTRDEPAPASIPCPTALHYFERRKLVDAYVFGEPLRSLCGEWIIPTKDAETSAHLPICEDCEEIEPAAQDFLDHLRKTKT